MARLRPEPANSSTTSMTPTAAMPPANAHNGWGGTRRSRSDTA